MSDHSELLKDARELVDEAARIPPKPPGHRNLLEDCAGTMHLLIGVIEEHDKRPTFDENFKALKDQLDDLDQRMTVNDELLAACRTCDEAIREILGCRIFIDAVNETERAFPTQPVPMEWINLRAAGDLVKREVEKADKLKGGE